MTLSFSGLACPLLSSLCFLPLSLLEYPTLVGMLRAHEGASFARDFDSLGIPVLFVLISYRGLAKITTSMDYPTFPLAKTGT